MTKQEKFREMVLQEAKNVRKNLNEVAGEKTFLGPNNKELEEMTNVELVSSIGEALWNNNAEFGDKEEQQWASKLMKELGKRLR